MLSLLGDGLVWIAAVAALPVMALPLAAHLGRGDRLGAAIIWLLASAGVAGAGTLFAHLAVDLAGPPLDARLAFWLAASAALIGAANLAAPPAALVARAASTFAGLTKGVGRAATWLVIAMALVQFAVVVMRYVFGINFIWMQESVTYMHGAVFLAASGYALLTDDHVRVDIFYREAPAKRKALVDLLGTYLFLFPFCLLILWTASPYVGQAWAVQEGSPEQSGIQGVFLLKSLIPIFALLLAMAGFVTAARACETLKGARP